MGVYHRVTECVDVKPSAILVENHVGYGEPSQMLSHTVVTSGSLRELSPKIYLHIFSDTTSWLPPKEKPRC